MVCTKTITTSQATYARAALYRLAGRWWWVAVVPMFGFAIASLWDISYLFGALIWLLLLVPPGLMMAYYGYLLKPGAAALSRPHRVTFGEGREVKVSFESDDNGKPIHDDIYLPSSALKDVVDRSNCFELIYKGAPIDILIIPYQSMSPDEAAAITREFLG